MSTASCNVQAECKSPHMSLWFQAFKLIGTSYNELHWVINILLRSVAFVLTKGLQALIPLGFGILIKLLIQEHWAFWDYVLGIWSFSETVFYLKMRIRSNKLNKRNNFITMEYKERDKLINQVYEHVDDFEVVLKKWLVNPPKTIQVEHAAEWLKWAFFGKTEQKLTLEEAEHFSELQKRIRTKMVRTAQPIEVAPISCLRPTVDHIKTNSKPLISYLVLGIPKLFGNCALIYNGFTRSVAGEIAYWTYVPPVISDPLPIFFVHGVGIGLSMYLNLILQIMKDKPNRRIFLLEVPYVSLNPSAHVSYIEETLSAIDFILDFHSATTCSWLAHSYGTVITAWVIKNRPSYVTKVSLIDPICFQLWDASLPKYSLYVSPISFIHHICQFFVIQDHIISHAISRSFQWTQNILFPESFTTPTWIYYSEYDYVFDAPSVYRYLKDRLRKLPQKNFHLRIEPVTHGGYLFIPDVLSKVISNL